MGFQDVNDTARAQGPEGVRNRSDGARPIRNGGGRWEAPPAPATLAAVNAAFRKWLVLKDLTPVHAVLGAVAANLLPGDPVWLGVIAPPSTAKTEILNALARIPHVEAVATLSMAALLSGTPKGQKAAGSKGGLLRKIGDFGVLVLKDFGLDSQHAARRSGRNARCPARNIRRLLDPACRLGWRQDASLARQARPGVRSDGGVQRPACGDQQPRRSISYLPP